MFSKPVTLDEERFIKNNAGKMSISEIALSLGRSYYTVQKILKLLGYDSGIHRWTPDEDAKLLSLWKDYPAGYISRCLDVDENAIYNRIRRLKKKGLL